jgi:hypothetical protein
MKETAIPLERNPSKTHKLSGYQQGEVLVLTAGKESLHSYRCGTRGIVVM